MRYKLCKFCENRARDTPLWGVYISDFGQIWVKISILGVLHPCRCTDGGEIFHGGGDLWSPPPWKISPPSVQRVAPAGDKPQNRPLSKLNTGRFALRAMLPVMSTIPADDRCRKFADYTVDHYTDSGCDFAAGASSPQQSPTTTNATYMRGRGWPVRLHSARWISLCTLMFFCLVVATCFLFCLWLTLTYLVTINLFSLYLMNFVSHHAWCIG